MARLLSVLALLAMLVLYGVVPEAKRPWLWGVAVVVSLVLLLKGTC
jgi:ABC-type multidrug transport system permease subunit